MRFVGGEFYHIYNRGVEGRDIFMKPTDYQRFLDGLFAFNADYPISLRDFNYQPIQQSEKLCSLICYVLMKNHVHFVVGCNNPENLSKFLQKIFIGYTAFFNQKYGRDGVLFQGGSRSKHVDDNRYIGHIVDYVHLNPLDYSMPEWRIHGVRDMERAKNMLLQYPYSSLNSFLGTYGDPALDFEATQSIFPDPKNALHSALEWASASLENSDAIWEG